MVVFHDFINTSKKFYFTLVSLTQVLTYFLLFGSITMMYQFVDVVLKNQKGEMWERYKGTALLRGYALSTLWVVTVPSFIVVVDTLNASIYISIAQGFGIALIGTIIGVFFVSSAERRQNLDITSVLQKEINTVLVNASHNKEERSEEHTSELQSRGHLVCRFLLEKKKRILDHSMFGRLMSMSCIFLYNLVFFLTSSFFSNISSFNLTNFTRTSSPVFSS